MSLTGGSEVIDLVSSDEVSSGKEAMDVIDLTASSEEDNGESNREDETEQEKDEKLAIVASASAITTYKERETKQKRKQLKTNPWPTRKSRTRVSMARRAPIRDSKRIYHAKTMQTKFMQAYLQVPGVLEALQLLRSKQAEEQKAEVLFEDNNHGPLNEEHEEQVGEQIGKPTAAEAGPAPAISWPASITHSLELTVKDGVQVKDTWPADRCLCYINCYPDTCLNAVGTLFCKPENCNLRGRCSNSVYETCHAELFKSEIGIGVRATELIPAGATIAPYTGLLTDFDYDNQDHQYEYVVSLQTRGRGNKRLYIDAQEWGTLARFINHSCKPNTEFVEMRNKREVQVMVKTIKEIKAGEEITVDYGLLTWFPHQCKTKQCREKNTQ